MCFSNDAFNLLNKIKDFLGNELFKEIFELILCDRGFEFKDPIAMETCGETGELLTRVFYCDPQRRDQKGKCESWLNSLFRSVADHLL